MTKENPRYLLIGGGKVATHMAHYLRLMNLPFDSWHRAHDTLDQLHAYLAAVTHILILINDDAIESFSKKHLMDYPDLIRVHFSGSLTTSLAYSAHPLYAFSGDEPYSFDEYTAIPFMFESEGLDFSEILPGFKNPGYAIKAEEKPYYHALCVIANNFTTLLWDKCFKEMRSRWGVETQDIIPFLEVSFKNLKKYPHHQLTGPLARGDQETLQRDLSALKNDSFFEVFKSFMSAFSKEDK